MRRRRLTGQEFDRKLVQLLIQMLTDVPLGSEKQRQLLGAFRKFKAV